MREPKSKLQVNLSVPLNKSEFKITDDDCFGNEWDISVKECTQCGMKEVCGILYRNHLKKEAKKIEDKTGTLFLDTCDFELVDKVQIMAIADGQSTPWLIEIVMKQARTSDVDSATSFIKSWRSDGHFSIKNGIITVL